VDSHDNLESECEDEEVMLVMICGRLIVIMLNEDENVEEESEGGEEEDEGYDSIERMNNL
jgi:hypothetical protein